MVDVGLTLMDAPVLTAVPPQLPVYQSIACPEGTVAESVDEAPLQMVAGAAAGLVGALGSALTVTETLAQEALTQPVVVFRARPKYVVVEVGLTPSEVPLPTSVPPQLPVYQSIVWPAGTLAESVDVAPLQIVAGVADGLVGALGSELTVTVTLAHDELVQGGVSRRA